MAYAYLSDSCNAVWKRLPFVESRSWAKTGDFKIRPLEKNLGGKWWTGVGVVRYVPEGYILLPKKNFPGRPLKICGPFKNYAKNDPQQWSYLWARAPTPLSVTP